MENQVSNTTCDICGAALGATIVHGQTGTLSGGRWAAYSALVTMALSIVVYFLGLSGVYLLVAAFYGAFIASYSCANNIVWEASIGAVIGIFAALFLILLFEPGAMKAFARGATATSSHAKVILLYGLIIVLPVLYAAGLIGAVAGEMLAQRRHHKRPSEAGGDTL